VFLTPSFVCTEPANIISPHATNTATSAPLPPHCSYAKTEASLLQAASGALLVPRAAFPFTTVSHSTQQPALPPPSLNRHSRTCGLSSRTSFLTLLPSSLPYLLPRLHSFPSSRKVPACSAVQNRRCLGHLLRLTLSPQLRPISTTLSSRSTNDHLRILGCNSGRTSPSYRVLPIEHPRRRPHPCHPHRVHHLQRDLLLIDNHLSRHGSHHHNGVSSR
jgi:hypothetical protein